MTENPIALCHWIICGPELARCVSQFENQILSESTNPQNHEEGLTVQKSFKQHTEKLIEAIKGFGNPFEDDCPELLVLNTRDCADDSIIETV